MIPISLPPGATVVLARAAGLDVGPEPRPGVLRPAVRDGLFLLPGRRDHAGVRGPVSPPQGPTAGRRPHAQHAAGDLLDRHPAGDRDRLLRHRPAVLRRSRIAAGGGRRGRRRGQPMALQFQVSQRGRIERVVPAGRSAGGAEAHLQGRHPRPLHPGLPRAAQRRAGQNTEIWFKPTVPTARTPSPARRISTTSSARSTAATATPK